MKIEMGKLFRKGKEITIMKYDPKLEVNYYNFIDKYHRLGFRQIILTSEIMIELANHYFLTKYFNVTKIVFMETDDELNDEISYLLRMIQKDRAYWGKLIERLSFLSNDESIDIERIELIGKDNEQNNVRMFYQVNGIFGINDNSFSKESKAIIPIITKKLL
ncbi:MAG: hypothetical protein ACFWUC_01900 [Oscillospiraceae bacterium]|jgi:hypothetical protein